MRSFSIYLSTLFIVLFIVESIQAQNRNSVREDVSITMSSSELDNADTFSVKNIHGDVKVTGYDGEEIRIEGTKEVWKRRGDVSRAEANEIKVSTRLYEGVMYLYLESPENHPEFFDGRMEYHWHNDRGNDRNQIRFRVDLEIKVPNSMKLEASTVNGGEVFVENMLNGVHASNVNGNVRMKDVKGDTDANTVNGNIEVWFLESPDSDSDFKTVNGTIEIYSPVDLNAIVTFESLHGELYTDFEQIKRLPNRLSKEEDGEGYRYRIDQRSPIQIGEGIHEMTFKMVNGNAYIRQRKS